MFNRLPKSFFISLIGLLIFSIQPLVVMAQTPAQTSTVAILKADNSKIWAESNGNTAGEALAAAQNQLTESVRLRFRNLESAIENSLPELDDRQRMAKLAISLKSNSIEYAVVVKKKPAGFYAFVYTDSEEGRRFVLDRSLAGLKKTGLFRWGEGFGADVEKANAGARESLISQISQTIETSTSISTTEQKGSVSETFQNRTKAFSRMTLQGVKTTSPIETEKSFYVIAFISNEDLEKSFAPAKSRVLSSVQEGEKYESLGNIQAALQNFYKAYLYADGYYTSIPYTFRGQTEAVADIRASLRAKIEYVLGTMPVTMKPAYEIGEELIFVPFDVSFNSKKVSGVTYETRAGGTSINDRVRGGRGRLELSNYEPSDKTEMFDVYFGVDITEDLQRDEELQLFEPARRIRLQRNLEADFSNIFKVNIEAAFKGAEVYFQTKTKNIAALAGKWSFGDDQESSELNPKHTYTSDGVFKVTLFVNGDTSLSDTKFVYLKDQTLRKTKVEEINAVGTAMLLAPVEAQLNIPAPDTIKILPIVATVLPDTVKKSVPVDSVSKVQIPKKDSVSTPIARVPVDEKKIFAGKKEAAKAKDVYEEIRFIESTDQLLRVLSKKKNANEYLVGKQTDLPDSDGAMVIIVSKRSVIDKLVFSQNRYMSLLTGQEITDLKTRFAGQGYTTIWVQAIVKETL